MYISDFTEFQAIPWYQDRAFLHQKYIAERMSSRQIAKLIGSSRSTVITHLKTHGIRLRRQEESHAMNPGQVRYGSKLLHGQLVENKGETQIIQKMVSLRKQGFSYWKIAAVLSSMAIPTKSKTAKWQAATVMKILKAQN
ncbi:MAG: hypothetical protein COT73_04745 [Bdellovibrio sp. CG10_big_fil_rev_8_21_14_0_10_47_8]|nr:MAG: hypothetical protein COT73_04745 [Bdellovibrio sp. CG10_big_fil_rev_8_21_14_0_10_47_8]